ncbi:DNA polymerase subunit gamma-2, mitochondrial-like isoform X2 [Watersipora subatra]|uniref:DNA polymerase subunit gamma-2, mitochondrial-like isoform X2 n=1 Tax=Watersipora subatra TaxID=2589382 RepID=UPI00355C2B80
MWYPFTAQLPRFNENVAAKEKISMVSSSLFLDSPDDKTLRHSLSYGCRQQYAETLNSHSKKFPFGIASSGLCINLLDEMPALDMQRPTEFTECLIQYFIPEKLVMESFHRLEMDHLMWWKKLSNSKDFSCERIGDELASTASHIVYSCPHGNTTVESIDVSGPHTELELSPYVIEARISVDVAMLVLLHDAYKETSDKHTQMLSFHQRLAPYKLGILFNGEDMDSLGIIADYITSELRKEAIMIQTDCTSVDQTRLQQSGVPYVVQLTDKTIHDGTVYLQDLSASTKEMVHATKLKEIIVRYVNSM